LLAYSVPPEGWHPAASSIAIGVPSGELLKIPPEERRAWLRELNSTQDEAAEHYVGD